MAGCPARKSRSTCNWPILRCRSSMTFCASSAAGALLPRANNSLARFISSCFQVLIIVGWTPNSDDSSARVFSPDSAAIAARALNSALCCFLFTPTSHASFDRSAPSLFDCPENRSRRTFDVARPSFERCPALIEIRVAIVNRSDAANRAGHVVENLVDDVRRDIEPRHPGRSCSPQVVQDPAVDRRLIGVFAGAGEHVP